MLGRTFKKISLKFSDKMGASNSSSTKILLAMDFDHTVVDANTDVEVQGLAENGKIPPEIRELYTNRGWADYMQAIFELLHSQGVKETDLKLCIQRLPFTEGMQDLIRSAGSAENIEVILISDSNSQFIDWILTRHSLKESVDMVFTNPAEFDQNGCLKISWYHRQDWCELSSKNLCKGHIMEEYVKQREKEDSVKFRKVIFVGDGKNDLCPAARLDKNGVVCARKGFKMEQVLRNGQIPLKSKICYWESGREIFPLLDLEPPPETHSDPE